MLNRFTKMAKKDIALNVTLWLYRAMMCKFVAVCQVKMHGIGDTHASKLSAWITLFQKDDSEFGACSDW